MFENMGIDILEQNILDYEQSLLALLLQDKTTQQNIIWATSDYADVGAGYAFFDQILPERITGTHAMMIQPRIAKAVENQSSRTRDKAEVFTPSWVCNAQNNLVDEQWFGRENIFNIEENAQWRATEEPIAFPASKSRSWEKYVDAQRLEISCGEAPYLVSRYDTVTGETIPLARRIGLLDRKLRVVSENTETEENWLFWCRRAFQSVYGFEYQGDSLLLARENLFATFIEYYQAKFQKNPPLKWLKMIANVIAWNLWQMDGIKYVVPNSCHPIPIQQMSMYDDEETMEPCPGCQTGNILAHTGKYCRIYDWRSKKGILFVSMVEKGGRH